MPNAPRYVKEAIDYLGAERIGERIYVVGGATKPGGSGTSDLNEVLIL